MLNHLALSDNGFLFDTRTGHTYSLSTTGTFLLKRLMSAAEARGTAADDDAADGVAPEALAQAMVERFQVDADTARRDVEQFLFRVRDMGLIPKADHDEARGAGMGSAVGARS